MGNEVISAFDIYSRTVYNQNIQFDYIDYIYIYRYIGGLYE